MRDGAQGGQLGVRARGTAAGRAGAWGRESPLWSSLNRAAHPVQHREVGPGMGHRPGEGHIELSLLPPLT